MVGTPNQTRHLLPRVSCRNGLAANIHRLLQSIPVRQEEAARNALSLVLHSIHHALESAIQRRGKPRTMSPRMNMASTFSVPALVLLKFHEGVLCQIIEVGVLLRLFLCLLQLLWLSMRLLCTSKCRVLPLHSLVRFSVIFTLFLFSVSVSLSHSSVSRWVSPTQTPSCASSTALSAARHTLRFL